MTDSSLLTNLQNIRVSEDNPLILPFFSQQPQQLRRVPFADTCLMLILNGEKQLHQSGQRCFGRGHCLLVPAGSELTFTNQPDANGYLAWVIPLPGNELQHIPPGPVEHDCRTFIADDLLLILLQQWLQLPAGFRQQPENVSRRRTEIIHYLQQRGFTASLRAGLLKQWSARVRHLLGSDLSHDWQLTDVCARLAVSESTLRRKLDDEGTGFRDLLSELRLSHGLNLLQVSQLTIQQIADACGYRSASRFSERFRLRFGVSPSELRAQRDLTVSGAKATVSGVQQQSG